MLNPGPSSAEDSGGIKCAIHSHKGYECRLCGDVVCPFWGVEKGTGTTDEATVPRPSYPLLHHGICGTVKTF